MCPQIVKPPSMQDVEVINLSQMIDFTRADATKIDMKDGCFYEWFNSLTLVITLTDPKVFLL